MNAHKCLNYYCVPYSALTIFSFCLTKSPLKLVSMPMFHSWKEHGSKRQSLAQDWAIDNTKNKIWVTVFWFHVTVSPTIESSVINTTEQHTHPHIVVLPPSGKCYWVSSDDDSICASRSYKLNFFRFKLIVLLFLLKMSRQYKDCRCLEIHQKP